MNLETPLHIRERFEACIIAGAIGDAWGSSYENQPRRTGSRTFYWHPIEPAREVWSLTDDTQLTLASCEALAETWTPDPELLSRYFVKYYQQNRLPGIGASTLKAIRELQEGGHWSQVGRSGEFAAGNGAAMRIAPFAFIPDISREEIRNICRITHRNDEAYVGALAIILAVRAALNKEWTGNENLLEILIPQLPDTRVRDRLIEIREIYDQATIESIAAMGTDGYVVNAVPFAVFAASRVMDMGLQEMLMAVIDAGGDTDTNASMAGQIVGALMGLKGIPVALMQQISQVPGFSRLKEIVNRTAAMIN